MINEEGDFECNTGTDGKPLQLFQCRGDVVSETEIFIRQAAVCRTVDRGRSVNEVDRVTVVDSGDVESLNKNMMHVSPRQRLTCRNLQRWKKYMFWQWRRHVESCLVCTL